MFRFHIEKDIDLKGENAHAKLIKLVGTGKKILEFGCSTGYVSKAERGDFANVRENK